MTTDVTSSIPLNTSGRKALTVQEQRFLDAAIRLGQINLGRTSPNPSVGALIVKDTDRGSIIVGRGVTQPSGRPHAEVMALRQAGQAAKGATCYVSLEPCSIFGVSPPCTKALQEAGIARVITATEDPDTRVSGRGIEQLLSHGIEVKHRGAIEAGRAANFGHHVRIFHARPAVTLKLAISKDGMVGRENAPNTKITGTISHAIVHTMRAQTDAIMVGAGTVLADNPSLTCRLNGMEEASPIRIIMDTHARTLLSVNLIQTAQQHQTILVTAQEKNTDHLVEAGVQIIICPLKNRKLDLPVALKKLGEHGITSILLEGGPTLAKAFQDQDLIDRAFLFKSEVQINEEGDAIPAQIDASILQANGLSPYIVETYDTDKLTRYTKALRRS